MCSLKRPGSAPTKAIAGARQIVEDRLGELLVYARHVGKPLTVEPLHPMYADRACVNTMAHALDLCDPLDPQRSGAVGVAVDVYHTWWDPQLAAQIKRAGRSRLLAFHVCDWKLPIADLLNDRGMLSYGVIDIPKIRVWVEDGGLVGFCEAETLSHHWWSQPMDVVIEICIEHLPKFG